MNLAFITSGLFTFIREVRSGKRTSPIVAIFLTVDHDYWPADHLDLLKEHGEITAFLNLSHGFDPTFRKAVQPLPFWSCTSRCLRSCLRNELSRWSWCHPTARIVASRRSAGCYTSPLPLSLMDLISARISISSYHAAAAACQISIISRYSGARRANGKSEERWSAAPT